MAGKEVFFEGGEGGEARKYFSSIETVSMERKKISQCFLELGRFFFSVTSNANNSQWKFHEEPLMPWPWAKNE